MTHQEDIDMKCTEYTRFDVTEESYCTIEETFDCLEDALKYISDKYGADNIIDQLVQINASNEDGDQETLTYFEVYDLIEK